MQYIEGNLEWEDDEHKKIRFRPEEDGKFRYFFPESGFEIVSPEPAIFLERPKSLDFTPEEKLELLAHSIAMQVDDIANAALHTLDRRSVRRWLQTEVDIFHNRLRITGYPPELQYLPWEWLQEECKRVEELTEFRNLRKTDLYFKATNRNPYAI